MSIKESNKIPALFLSGDVNEEMLMRVLPFLHGNKNKQVKIFICSQGGDTLIGYEIYKLFKAHKKVTCIATGYCQSIATIIMLGANSKIATVDCEFLIHHGLTSFTTRATEKAILELNKKIDELYLKSLKITKEQLDYYNNAEHPIDFNGAVELGLIDKEYQL